jgi:hypothetical protein
MFPTLSFSKNMRVKTSVFMYFLRVKTSVLMYFLTTDKHTFTYMHVL